jgi:hypothetical protein
LPCERLHQCYLCAVCRVLCSPVITRVAIVDGVFFRLLGVPGVHRAKPLVK